MITNHKRIGTGNSTHLSNITKLSLNQNTTKLSLNQNTTKLSLGDKTLQSNKLVSHNQSKSTIKKAKYVKKS